MYRLVIRHQPEDESEGQYRFQVERLRTDGVKAAPAVDVDDPLSRRLGETNLRLGEELTWYLESYLDYPFGPNAQRAERVLDALRAWGREAFEALFGEGQARDYYRDATRAGHAELQLGVSSDDARVLAWPWEALRDPLIGDLAHHCRIERQLNDVGDPPEPHPGLSQERIGILLVTARPYDRDVAYRSISRPLVELIRSQSLPASVKLLRPPTFENLREELRAHPGAYHIVHFDGHGGCGRGPSSMAGDRLQGPQGRLIFEKEDGSEDPVEGGRLSELLREHRIPIAVLNACQSAMLGEDAEDAFASVATSLLRAGVRSVVAMGYSLYVSAARELLPAFYRRLFASGNVAEAVRAGRQALLARPERRPGFALQDWLVPVLYEQQPLEMTFASKAVTEGAAGAGAEGIPDEARLSASEAPYGLIGRDSAILSLERASRRAPAAMLIHGLGGIGKTTLARGYLEWLQQTEGLPEGVIWQSFVEVRSFDYVRNRLVELLFGTNAMALPDEKKWPALVETLRKRALLLVWDNFESVSGTADAGGERSADAMPAEDLKELSDFLRELRGGGTRVVLTSRSGEEWLGTEACWRVPLGGLQGEERQELARAILADQGIAFDRHDQAVADLIDELEGHPLMMRTILPRLGKESAPTLLAALERYVPQAGSSDPVERKLYATLRYVEEGLPAELRPLLADRDDFDAAEEWYRKSLEIEERLGNERGTASTYHQLGTVAGKRGDFDAAEEWSRKSLEIKERLGDERGAATTYHQRGWMAEERLDFDAAEEWFRKSLEIKERLGDERGAANTYHQLGRVAEERRDFEVAEEWYRKSLEIEERLGNEHGASITHYQLGRVAEERRDFDAAEEWYRKALVTFERLHDDHNAAIVRHNLELCATARQRKDNAQP